MNDTLPFPAEIRNTIYTYVHVNTVIPAILHPPDPYSSSPTIALTTLFNLSAIPLHQTCKRIYAEALPILYQTCALDIQELYAVILAFNVTCKHKRYKLDSRLLNQVRCVCIHHRCLEYLLPILDKFPTTAHVFIEGVRSTDARLIRLAELNSQVSTAQLQVARDCAGFDAKWLYILAAEGRVRWKAFETGSGPEPQVWIYAVDGYSTVLSRVLKMNLQTGHLSVWDKALPHEFTWKNITYGIPDDEPAD